MKSLSLKWKIVLACGLPILFLIGFSIHYIKETYNILENAKITKDHLNVIGAASSLVHELQKERGKQLFI